MRPGIDDRLADAGLAIAMTLVLAVTMAADPRGDRLLPGLVFAVGFGLVLLLRRRYPRMVLLVTVLAVFSYYALGFPPIGMVLPATGALFSAAEQRRTGWAIGTAIVLLAVATIFRVFLTDPGDVLQGYTFVTEIALAAAAIALGAAVRLTREARERTLQVAELTAAEEAHAADARMQEERMQIARDLHDTIGHTLSVASLHAGVAAEATDATASRAALDQVRAASSEALRELRRTVKVLRADQVADSAPVLGIAALDAVFDAARTAGLRVEVVLSVSSDALSRSVDAAAYRIVQESLTNVLKHAQARVVRVTARVAGGMLTLQIADDGTSARTGVRAGERAGTGVGIRGMRERAEILGGRLTASAAPGGFVVAAEIPARAEGEI